MIDYSSIIESKVNSFLSLGKLNILREKVKLDILPWIDANVKELNKNTYKFEKLYKYQRDILLDTQLPKVEQITLCCVPRIGKTTTLFLALAYRCVNRPQPSLVIFESEKKAEEIVKTDLLPILKNCKELEDSLSRPYAVKTDKITLQDNVVYCFGAGVPTTSLTIGGLYIDELDFWGTNGDSNINNLINAKIRTSTYPIGQRLIFVSSSPNATGAIWKEWQAGSRGVWHNACINCKQLYPAKQLAWLLKDGGFGGLQWDKSETTGKINEDSLRWICPACRYSHKEHEAPLMAEQGRFMHQDELNHNRSYQVGAMASGVYSWLTIAQAIEAKKESLDSRRHFYWNICGVPFKDSEENEVKDDTYYTKTVKSHYKELIQEIKDSVVGVFASCDVQSELLQDEAHNYYLYVVRGIDNAGNTYLLDTGRFEADKLQEFLDSKYLNLPIALCIVDSGGFSRTEKNKVILPAKNAIYYKGDNQQTEIRTGKVNYVWNKELKMVLASPTYYQAQTLYNIYGKDSNKWFICCDYSKEYVEQVANIQPKNNEDEYEKWVIKKITDRRDFFDAEKMLTCLLDCLYNNNFPIAILAKNYKNNVVPKCFLDKINKRIAMRGAKAG